MSGGRDGPSVTVCWTPHGAWNTPAYRSWAGMKQRCTNPKNPGYLDYGGRGIRVAVAWLSFANFLADMGVRPRGTTLDRVDNAGNYEPGNCRWATRSAQNRNRRDSLGDVAAVQVRWLCTDGGFTKAAVAAAFNTSATTVRKAVTGERYRDAHAE